MTFFILVNALVGAGIVVVVVFNIFALHGAARIAISALSVAVGILILYRLSSWATKKERRIYIDENDQDTWTSALKTCKKNIAGYLRENRSTYFFTEKLNTVSDRIDTFSSRCHNIRDVITRRFGSTGLSYGKFLAPVTALQEYLTDLTNSLISRMRMFNEWEYSRRINEFTLSKRAGEAASYKEVEQEYKDYVEKIIATFDDAILKLDRLTLEISKLSEADIEKAMNIMHDLDDVIQDTQLYK
jgi:xanthosine utilization system XapX-like protein